MRQTVILLLGGCVLSVLLMSVPSHKALAVDECCATEATAKIAAKPAAALVDRPEYLVWKNFRPGAKVVYAARYWNLTVSNKFVAGPTTSLYAYQLRVINAEGVRLWFSQAPTDRYGRPMPPNEWEETIAAQYDPNIDPSANQSRYVQLLTVFRQAGNLDKPTETDVLRFMRAAKAMKGDADYFTLASNLNDMGLPGESKAVVDEGGGCFAGAEQRDRQ